MKTSKFLLTATAVTTLCVVAIPPVIAQQITVDNTRARPSLGVAKNTATFFTIHNHTSQNDKLVSAESDVSRKVELHTHLKENGVFKMRQVKFIELPTKSKVELKSGGLHVMIIGVHNKLKVGDKFDLKLNFEKAKSITISVPVKKHGAGHKMMKHKKMDHKKMDGMKKPAPAN